MLGRWVTLTYGFRFYSNRRSLCTGSVTRVNSTHFVAPQCPHGSIRVWIPRYSTTQRRNHPFNMHLAETDLLRGGWEMELKHSPSLTRRTCTCCSMTVRHLLGWHPCESYLSCRIQRGSGPLTVLFCSYGQRTAQYIMATGLHPS